MKDPPRWFDDPSVPAEHRRLLLAAVPPPPMTPGHDGLFQALAGNLATGAAIGKAVAIPLLAKLLVVSATLGVGTATGYMVTKPLLLPAPVVVVAKEQPQRDSSAELVAIDPQPQPATSSAGVTPDPSPTGVGPKPSHVPTVRELPVASVSSIRDEAALLERARRALSESPQRALSLVDEHAQRYASGQLAAERELIAVQALVNLGRLPAAQARASRFFATHQSSVYQRRMRKVLGIAKEPNDPVSP